MAKVVKWSQNMIFVDGNPFFSPPPDFEIALKHQFSKYLGLPEMALPSTKIMFRDHFTIDRQFPISGPADTTPPLLTPSQNIKISIFIYNFFLKFLEGINPHRNI